MAVTNIPLYMLQNLNSPETISFDTIWGLQNLKQVEIAGQMVETDDYLKRDPNAPSR